MHSFIHITKMGQFEKFFQDLDLAGYLSVICRVSLV